MLKAFNKIKLSIRTLIKQIKEKEKTIMFNEREYILTYIVNRVKKIL